jgi:hypothetical protein
MCDREYCIKKNFRGSTDEASYDDVFRNVGWVNNKCLYSCVMSQRSVRDLRSADPNCEPSWNLRRH